MNNVIKVFDYKVTLSIVSTSFYRGIKVTYLNSLLKILDLVTRLPYLTYMLGPHEDFKSSEDMFSTLLPGIEDNIAYYTSGQNVLKQI